MKILKKVITLTIVFILSIQISNIKIDASVSSNFNNQNKVSAGVLLYSFNDLFMAKIKENLESFQTNKDYVSFSFFNSQDNSAIQNEILDSLFKSNINLLVLNLINPTNDQLKDIINNAKQKNISLIILNIDPQDIPQIAQSYNKVAFFLNDSKQLGTLEGKILADKWNTNKKSIDKNNDNIMQYIILQGDPNSKLTTERTNSAISAIENAGIKMQLLDHKTAFWDKELSESVVDSLFLKYDGNIEAIISNNDAMAIGAIASLQKYGYNKGDNLKSIPIVGIDGLKEAKELIDKDMMTGTVSQDLNIIADTLYNVGINLIYNADSLQNVDHKLVDGKIVFTLPYSIYTKQSKNN